MSVPFPNLYTHRKVADTAAKACDVCYKPSSSVLITADKKVMGADFFYVCPAHLQDTYFCTPKIDEPALQARREKALAAETEKLKREYQERQQKKRDQDPGRNPTEGPAAGEGSKTKDDATKRTRAGKGDATGQKGGDAKADDPSGWE
ncbi:hypothetical protein E4U41_003608, partial [Claviceps citrina]